MENDKVLNAGVMVGDKVAIKSDLNLTKMFGSHMAAILKLKNEFIIKFPKDLRIKFPKDLRIKPLTFCLISNEYTEVNIPVECLEKIPVDRSHGLRDIPKFSKGDLVKFLATDRLPLRDDTPLLIIDSGLYDIDKNTYTYVLENYFIVEESWIELAEPVPTSNNECRKNDIIDDKLRWDLLPLSEIEDIVAVYSAGAKKYGPNRWQGLEDGYNRYKGALLRHIMEYEKGNVMDSDTGCHHLAQVAWNAIAMLYMDKQGNGLIGKKKEVEDAGVGK